MSFGVLLHIVSHCTVDHVIFIVVLWYLGILVNVHLKSYPVVCVVTRTYAI